MIYKYNMCKKLIFMIAGNNFPNLTDYAGFCGMYDVAHFP